MLAPVASGKRSKAVRNARSVVTASRPRPWGTVAAVVAVVVFAGTVFGFLYFQYDQGTTEREALAAFTPTAQNQDPAAQIPGITVQRIDAAGHVTAPERVAYQTFPPFAGAHDGVWAQCTGTVYEVPVRNENMVHALEHGAVWIAYNPEQVTGAALQSLVDRVEGQDYLMLSPYPGLESPVSLQSWGHQLTVPSADDPRIDQFIRALRLNQYTHPEVGASCEVPAGAFDPANPPPFIPEPPGPDATPQDYNGGRGTGG